MDAAWSSCVATPGLLHTYTVETMKLLLHQCTNAILVQVSTVSITVMSCKNRIVTQVNL